jgi:transposase
VSLKKERSRMAPVFQEERAMPGRVISDEVWIKFGHLIPKGGRPGKDNRNFIEAVYWIQRSGASWRQLPRAFGPWKTVYNRFNRWAKTGHLQDVFEFLKKEIETKNTT